MASRPTEQDILAQQNAQDILTPLTNKEAICFGHVHAENWPGVVVYRVGF